MRPLAKAALCGGLAYCLYNVGRAIWVAPGWCAILVGLLLFGYAFDAPFIEMIRAALGFIAIFAMVGIIGLWLNGSTITAIAAVTGLGIFCIIADMFVGNDAIAEREAARHARELASQALPATATQGSSTFVIPTLNGIVVLLVALGLVWGIIALCRVWNRHRQYNRQLEAFNFALRYEPDARLTCEPPKRPSRKPRAKPQEPAPYRPAPVYQAPVQQVAVYRAPTRPGWLAQGRREAGLG